VYNHRQTILYTSVFQPIRHLPHVANEHLNVVNGCFKIFQK
jgi:hypothetical protein